MKKQTPEKSLYVSLTYKCNRACSYCFAKGFAKKYPSEISLSDFKKLSVWLSEQNVNVLGLMGGEPTQHSDFSEICNIASDLKIRLVLTTNGIFGKEILDSIDSKTFKLVVVNYNEPAFYSEEEALVLEENIYSLNEKKVKVALRVNLYSPSISLEYVKKACLKGSSSEIYFAFASPGLDAKNESLDFKAIREISPFLKTAIEELEARGVKCVVNSCIPKCALPEEFYSFFQTRGLKSTCGFSGKKFTPLLLVQPDLSVNVCSRLPIKEKNILSFDSLPLAWAAFEKRFIELAEKPLFEKCKACKHSDQSGCIGACLIYKL